VALTSEVTQSGLHIRHALQLALNPCCATSVQGSLRSASQHPLTGMFVEV
jgi:hypothetical protein